MDDLDSHYARLLSVGFIVLREAIESNDRDWIDAELEFLHNIPSLIGEGNSERHKYFWFQERMHYLQWVGRPGRKIPKSFMLTFYKTIFKKMEPFFSVKRSGPSKPKKVKRFKAFPSKGRP